MTEVTSSTSTVSTVSSGSGKEIPSSSSSVVSSSSASFATLRASVNVEDINENKPSSSSSPQSPTSVIHLPRDPSPVTVLIRNARKTFGKGKCAKNVLCSLDLTVRESSIYGLLGASGCGKTTILSCIVGRQRLDEGRISIFGGTPGDRKIGVPGNRIGYMPQELALYVEFTVMETLEYFGRIYEMSTSEVRNQIKFLLKFLQLPDKDSIIRNLSGGQQRRVSFAVSLLHNPELLILDEPTVGVDPMLRQSIWNHLISLATKHKKTIIITTHYIEEARQATVVGMMRNGKLLAESPPITLLHNFGLMSLEDVFLKLCIAQENDSGDDANKGNKKCFPNSKIKQFLARNASGTLTSVMTLGQGTLKDKSKVIVYPGMTAFNESAEVLGISYKAVNGNALDPMASDKCSFSDHRYSYVTYSKLWALMLKNFIRMWRNKSSLIFIFMLPAIEVCLFCLAIGREPNHLEMAVVNDEFPFNDPLNYSCPIVPGCEFENLSCRFITNLTKDDLLVVNHYPDEESATAAAENGGVWGVIKLDANFSENFLNRLWNSLDSDEETLRRSSIQLRLDMSNQQVAFVLKKAVINTYRDFVKGLLSDCEFSSEVGEGTSPVIYGDPIYGRANPNFTEFMAPGLIILIVYFLAMALTGEAFLIERNEGLLDRSWVAGVTAFEYIFAAISSQFIVMFIQTFITLGCTLLIFQIPSYGPIFWLVVLTLLQGTAGMCFGFLTSTMCQDQTTAMQIGIGSFYPNLLLSGILWPLEGMPEVLRTVAWYLPSTAASQAMRDVMTRGWGISRPSIYLGVISSSVWIGIFIVGSWIVIRVTT